MKIIDETQLRRKLKTFHFVRVQSDEMSRRSEYCSCANNGNVEVVPLRHRFVRIPRHFVEYGEPLIVGNTLERVGHISTLTLLT